MSVVNGKPTIDEIAIAIGPHRVRRRMRDWSPPWDRGPWLVLPYKMNRFDCGAEPLVRRGITAQQLPSVINLKWTMDPISRTCMQLWE